MGSDIDNAHFCTFARGSSKKKNRGNKSGKCKNNNVDLNRGQCQPRVSNTSQICKVQTNAAEKLDPSAQSNNKTGGNPSRRARRNVRERLETCDNESVFKMASSCNGQSVHGYQETNLYRNRRRSVSGGSCSSSCSEDDKDAGCLDDWEDVSNVLTVDCHRQTSDTGESTESRPLISHNGSKPVNKSQCHSRAWSPDDVYRPQCLPRISHPQTIFVQNSEGRLAREPAKLPSQNVIVEEQQQSVCPLCCEDLDITDTNFMPCPCGFRLCLFCHKRILEVDERCPGCRKQYGSVHDIVGLPCAPMALQTANSCC